MLYKVNTKEEQIAGFRWEGVFDKRSLKEALAGFIPELRSRKKLKLYLEVTDINRIGPDELLGDLRETLGLFDGFEGKLSKIALVSDEDWFRELAENEQKKLSETEIRSFRFDQKEAAMDFLKP